MKITVKDITGKLPCAEWTEERLKQKIGDGKTLLEILSLRGVTAGDRIWCATKFLDDKANREFAIWCARQCKTEVKEITEYIDVIERYYSGKATRDALSAAYGAVYGAAYWAADRAADSAARSKQIKKLKELAREA